MRARPGCAGAGGGGATGSIHQAGSCGGASCRSSLVGDRPGNEHGHRHDRLGRGATAVVTGLQRPVPQVLVDGEHGPAVVQQDPAPGDQHLPVSSGLDRGPGPAAGDRACTSAVCLGGVPRCARDRRSVRRPGPHAGPGRAAAARCLTASAPHSVPPGSERSRASSIVFSTQVTSGLPVTSAMAAATSSATAYPSRDESSGFLWNRAAPGRPCARASPSYPRCSASWPPVRSFPHSREARLTSVSVGSTASAAARRVCPGQQRLGPALTGP